MIGVGELKKLNATDPKALFEQLKAIRLAALANLTRHVNKTMERFYRDLNDTDLVNASAKLGRGLDVAKKIRDVMRRSGAAPPAWLDHHIKALNEAREALNALLNATDIDRAEAALNRLIERLQNLPTLAKAAIAKQIERLREVINQAKTADPEVRRQTIEEIRRGNLEKARQKAEEARGKRNK
jgi:patatin-like phospholipase/acyl hydrolase